MPDPATPVQPPPSRRGFFHRVSRFRRNRAVNSEQEALRKQIRDLIAQIESDDKTKAAAAEQALWKLGPSVYDPLLEVWQDLSPRLIWQEIILLPIFLALCWLVVWLWTRQPLGAGIYLLWTGQVVSTTIRIIQRNKVRRTGVARLFTRLEDLRSIGPLVEAWFHTNRQTRKEIEKALIRLLPRLKASDVSLLNAHQRDCLHKLLAEYGNIKFILAVLQALAHVGDSRVVPNVVWLAEITEDDLREVALTTSVNIEADVLCIQQAAQECLLLLEARLEQERASQTLLRASSLSELAPDTLLRPAMDSTATEPQQLLRPGMRD